MAQPDPEIGLPTEGRARPPEGEPVFDRPHGPLLAVCGLAGGAGTSTLAYLLARHAVSESAAPILLAELDAASGGLAALAGGTSPRSLGDMASARTGDETEGGLPFARVADDLRLVASAPRMAAPATDDELARVLADARRVHALTVVDCGTLQTPGALGALEVATHVVWTVPVTPHAARSVAEVLLDESGPAPAGSGAPELLAAVATRPTRRRRGAGRALRDAAGERCERLVYVPFDKELADDRITEGPARLDTALTAIVAFVAAPAA